MMSHTFEIIKIKSPIEECWDTEIVHLQEFKYRSLAGIFYSHQPDRIWEANYVHELRTTILSMLDRCGVDNQDVKLISPLGVADHFRTSPVRLYTKTLDWLVTAKLIGNCDVALRRITRIDERDA